jgi:predicted MFS family arabinose efflux permease
VLLLQLCLLLLFAQDVFCFSLGYPFLPGYLAEHGHAGFGTAAAFGIYSAASIVTLLLLLMVSSSRASSSSSSRGLLQRPSAKFWLIVASTSLSAAAGAANTAAPASYAVLLMTKAVQGSASAFYFVYTLKLVAAVFPAAYKTQAMAFVSAGLTLGDALGPVVGGVVFQVRGLQQALGMQPLASGVALLALLMLVVVWPSRKRPWAQQKQQQQQQHQHLQKQQQQQQQRHHHHHGDVESAAADLRAPLLSDQHDQGITSSCGSSCSGGSQWCCPPPAQYRSPKCNIWHTYSSSSSWCSSSSCWCSCQAPGVTITAAATTQPVCVLSLCLLALMCQAARTALDLLLPMLLLESVQPGVVGALFAGEAVGSVVTPFVVDWLLQKQTSSSDDLQDSCQESIAEQEQQQQQQERDVECDVHRDSCRAAAVSSSSCNNHCGCLQSIDCSSRQQTSCCRQQYHRPVKYNSSSSSRRTALAANKLLFISAVGMAVSCCLVLTAWQLPIIGCSLAQVSSSSRAAAHVPAWLCPHTDAAAAAAASQPMLKVTGGIVRPASVGDSGSVWRRDNALRMPHTTSVMTAFQVHPQLMLGLRGSPVFVFGSLLTFTRQSSNSNSSSSSSSSSDSINTHLPLLDIQQAEVDAVSQNIDSTAAANDIAHPEAWQAADALVAREPVMLDPSAAEAAEALPGVAFGLLQLLVTGCVLALLGGCHSSCETLIYTVLTDLVGAAGDRQNGDRNVGCRTQDSHASGSSSSSCCCCGSSTACGAGAVQSALTHQKQPSAGSSTSKLHSSNAAVAKELHDGAQISSCCAAGEGAADSSDSTEVVMVLYVLFWVVGFTVGAVVADLPGGNVVGQQLTGCVMGLVLAAAGYWAWSTAAAAFSTL